MVEHFAKIDNSWELLNIFAKSSIIDVRLGFKYAYWFVDNFMETFNKGFFCSSIFSTFWACKKWAFPHTNWFSFNSFSMLKMFWITSHGYVKSFPNKQEISCKNYQKKLSHVNPWWEPNFTDFVLTMHSIKTHQRSGKVLIDYRQYKNPPKES